MSDAAGPWQGAVAQSPEEAAFQGVLQGDERIIWSWVEGRTGLARHWPRQPNRRADGMVAIVLGLLFAAAAWWLAMHGIERRRDLNVLLMILNICAAAFGLFLLVAPERWRRPVLKGAAELLTVEGYISGPGTLHALTQYRLLSTLDGAFSDVALVPGEPVIQYGKLRIDRPDRRGQALIERIPMPEQHRLFAALKRARAIREGREAA